jgi:hypothetical protein
VVVVCVFALAEAQFSWDSDQGWGSTFDTPSEPAPAQESSFDMFEPVHEPVAAPVPVAAEPAPAAARPARSPSSSFAGPQKSCPVCASTRLKNNLYVVHNGDRLHVCSAACIDRVRRNPGAFSERLKKRGERLARQ